MRIVRSLEAVIGICTEEDRTMKKSLVVIEPIAIESLNPADGIRLLRDLLWCEAMRLQIPRHKVVISSDITVPDGGIDASVDAPENQTSILAPGHCHYQIKTGASFKPWQQAQISKELFGDKPATRQNLGAAVAQCMESDSVYALVTLGHDLTTEQRSLSEKFLKQFFIACGFPSPRTMVFGVTQIISQLVLHPSLCLDLNGLGDLPFQSASSWMKNSDMAPKLALGETQEKFLHDLQIALDDPATQHVRIVGEPGIGKSRLVLESIIRNPILSAETLYVRQAGDFQSSPLFTELLKPGRDYSVLLVVDECDDADRSTIWCALKGRRSIKLITIDHGPEKSGGTGMKTLHVLPLEIGQIEEILRVYVGDSAGLHNWSEWCGGSARVAHALGENLRDNPEDILRTPGTVPVWERFISGYGKAGNDDSGRVVLRHIALFEKFGARIPVQNEADFIAKLVAKTDTTITRAKFDSIVTYYRQRRVLQGDRTLRIVPTALRIFLWRDWWENYGSSADFNEMMDGMPKSLYGWFMRSFIYAHDIEPARDVVKSLLNPQTGPFFDRDFLVSETGSAFISILAEADPASTLSLLRATILKWTDEEMQGLGRARQNLAWALEKIGVWEEHFRNAAKVLLRLSFGDKSKNSNNAKGMFVGFFSPMGAPTEAPFLMRVSLANEFLSSENPFERSMGLAASSGVLKNGGGGRIIGAEYQGLRPEVAFWNAKLLSELIEPWSEMLSILLRVRGEHDAAWMTQVDTALLSSIEQMARADVLHTELIFAMKELSKVDGNFQGLTQLVLRLLRYPNPNAPEEFAVALDEISEALIGTTFAERLRRYVLSTIWEDDYPTDQGSDDPVETVAGIRLGLAQEAANNIPLLTDALANLFISDSYRAEQFGFDIAIALAGAQLDHVIVIQTHTAQVDAQPMFLSGYLRGVYSMDSARWESLVEELIRDNRRWVVIAVVSSGMTDKIFDVVRDLYTSGAIDCACLIALSRGQTQSHVSTENIRLALRAMLARRDSGFYRIAIEMAERTLCRAAHIHPDDDALVFHILTDESALSARINDMDEHHWYALAKRFRKQFPNSDIALLQRLIIASGPYKGIATGGNISKIAGEICESFPDQAWELVSGELLGERVGTVMYWLGQVGSALWPIQPPLLNFCVNDIFDWIESDPSQRSLLIVDALIPTLESGPAGDLTKAFLAKYGDVESVGNSLMYKFHSGSLSGRRSEHYIQKRDLARKWLGEITSTKVQDWLSIYIDDLNEKIERAQIWEEREF